jgi:TPR repeat protein
MRAVFNQQEQAAPPPRPTQSGDMRGWRPSDFDRDPAAALAACRQTADNGNTEAQFTLAQKLEQGKAIPRDLTEARRYYRTAAEQGHTKAWFAYAVCAELGKGGPVDFVEAAKYYKLAADDRDGNVDSMVAYARIIETGLAGPVDIAEVLKYYDLSAKKGSSEGRWRYGRMFEFGHGVEANNEEAAKWYKLSSERNNPEGQCNYARLLMEGRGVSPNPHEAAVLFRAAAKAGNASAQCQYAKALDSGRGIGKNPTEAVKFYEESAKSGDAEGLVCYGEMLEEGKRVPRDVRRAVGYYELSANQGHPSGSRHYGEALESGEFVAVDLARAATLYGFAAEHGDCVGQWRYGRALESGRGVAVDVNAARNYYRLSSEQGLAEAQFSYANLLMSENRSPEDVAAAEALLERSAGQGNREARDRLGRIQGERRAVEERRIAEEARITEERNAAAARKAAEERQMAEEARVAAEKKAAQERRAAEERKAVAERQAAEERRIAEEARAAEERRAAAAKKAAEERRMAEEARVAAEKKAAQERRVADERKAAAERQAAEERRIAEEARVAAEKKAAQERRAAEERKAAAEKKAAELQAAVTRLDKLLADYRYAATQLRELLPRALDCLAQSARSSEKLNVRLAKVAEAKVVCDGGIANGLRNAVTIWTQITELCRSFRWIIPAVEPNLAVDELRQLQLHVETEIATRTRELERLSDESGRKTSGQKIRQYAAMLDGKERMSAEIAARGTKMSQDAQELNPGLDVQTKAKIQQDIERRARRGCQVIDPSQANQPPEKIEQSVVTHLMPNLAVQREVARVDPPSIDQVEQTSALTSDTSFTVSIADANAPLHILGAIAQQHNLSFALTPTPSAEANRDAWNNSADFAMANDVVSEGSMFLLGSTCPEHQVKGISLHLRGDFDELEANPVRKQQYMRDVQFKLAAVHGVSPDDIVILGLRRGSILTDYAVASGIGNTDGLGQAFAQQFGAAYWHHDLHHSFSHLQINPNTFDPRWNRDFRIPSMCPRGENRGKFPYTPPAGWERFGMNVSGKYGGNDIWLGSRNLPGEWALVYHGTKHRFVKSITETPLRAGQRAWYGHGIYCSPNPATSEHYTDCLELQERSGRARYKYMLVCRVNVSAVHKCAQCPCPYAQNNQYTVHITTAKDVWFVNCQNQSYQNIRPYGILVKRV